MARMKVHAGDTTVALTVKQAEALGLLAGEFTLYRTRWTYPRNKSGFHQADESGELVRKASWWLEAANGDRLSYAQKAMLELIDMGLVKAELNPPATGLGYRVTRYPHHLTPAGRDVARHLAGRERTDEGVHYE